jgi:hypothetical protein
LGSSRVPPASDKGSAELDVHWLFVAGGSCAQVDAMSYEALTSVQWAAYNRMHRFSIFFFSFVYSLLVQSLISILLLLQNFGLT